VNFFAHAVLASERSADAAFVLGAMLPDLCGFASVRLAHAAAGELAPGALREGVRFHHASDAAFHAHRSFGARCAELTHTLEARGVRRGPARGVAHVASELLLDGWLAREVGVPRAYRDALGGAPGLFARECFAPHERDAVAAVCARVFASPLPEAYADAAFVCERVERALAPRPFLALRACELPAVAEALAAEAAHCAAWAPRVLSDVRADSRLTATPFASEERP
jgi:hypothetical protein